MPKVLLVTNDFPPTIGGIQSYLRDFVACLDPADVVVFASTQDAQEAQRYDAAVDFTVIRWPRSVMLPTPATAARMKEIIAEYGIDTVWFGAAAPLAIMAGAARAAGASHIIATTHGHEVGWSMLPGARQLLGGIGKRADTVTYISQYTRNRLIRAFGPHPKWLHLPSAVNLDTFRPADQRTKRAAREALGLGESDKLIVCISRLVPRKGQDQLIRAMEQVSQAHPDAQLLIVGRGRYRACLERLAEVYFPSTRFMEAQGIDGLAQALAAADIFAMPARTRGGGLDVEGLGIVYLEAQAAGLPVIAGNSGGAPETVTAESGIVVDGTSVFELADALDLLLGDALLRQRMGEAGRVHVEQSWTWEAMGARLRAECGVSDAANGSRQGTSDRIQNHTTDRTM